MEVDEEDLLENQVDNIDQGNIEVDDEAIQKKRIQ
jgi:hypothetical protein